MDAEPNIINIHSINNMETVEEVIEYAKQSIETITGLSVTSIKFSTRRRASSLDKLKEAVCKAYNISVDSLLKGNSTQKFVRPRQMFYYIAMERMGAPVTYVSRMFGQNHTTGCYGINKVKGLLSIKDEETINKLELVNEYLK